LVRISKKQNFVEILFEKISECKKIGLGQGNIIERPTPHINNNKYLFYVQQHAPAGMDNITFSFQHFAGMI